MSRLTHLEGWKGWSLRQRLTALFAIMSAMIGLGLTLRLWSTVHGLPLDDAWIYLCYARSVAENATFGYTAGTWENGATSLLWPILAAVPLWLGLDPIDAVKLMGFLALCVLLISSFRVAHRLGGGLAGAAVVTVLALDPWLSVLSISGMEVVAAMAAAIATLDALLGRRFLHAGCWLAAAGLLRPELALLVPLTLPFLPFKDRRAWAELLIPPALAGGTWLVYSTVATGYPLPNSFWAKVHLGIPVRDQLKALGALFLSGPPWAVGCVSLAVIWATVGLVRKRTCLAPMLVAAPLALIIFYIGAVSLGGDYGPLRPNSVENIYFARYVLLVVPWIALLFAVGTSSIHAVVCQRAGPSWAAAAVLLALGLTVPAWQGNRAQLTEAYTADCGEVESVQVNMGQWIDQNLPDDAVIGVSDAGAIRYFAGQRIIDLTGLNTHELLREDDPTGWLLKQKLSHVAIWPHWHRHLFKDPRVRLTPIHTIQTEHPVIVPGKELVLFSMM